MSNLYQTMGEIALPADGDLMAWGNWLAQQVQAYDLKNNDDDVGEWTLLLHADDGVIWGRLDGKQLVISSNAYETLNVKLRSQTVQQMRLFNEQGEMLVWRTGIDEFRGRVVVDENEADTIDARHLLWGERTAAPENGFTLLREGVQGMWHAPPAPSGLWQSARLRVRHYVDYDAVGQAYVALSRLVSVDWNATEEEA